MHMPSIYNNYIPCNCKGTGMVAVFPAIVPQAIVCTVNVH